MNSLPERSVYRWLRKLEIDISFSYLEKELRSHYAYPSLLSITDTLDAMGIDNAAIVVDKDKVDKLPVPFLAYAYKNNSEFSIINNAGKSLNPQSEEFRNWSGVIIAAEKPDAVWQIKENKNWLRKEKRNKILLRGVGLVFLLLLLNLYAVDFSWLSAALLLTSIAGLLIAILIVLKEIGYNNRLTDKLCSISENTDCDAVMKSKGAQLAFGFGWADAGIIYFSSLVLVLILSELTGQQGAVNALLCVISILSFPFTVYSLYFQKQVAHKWCMLCLTTLGILWLQFALLFSFLFTGDFSLLLLKGLILVLISFFCTSSIWFLLKPVLVGRKDLQDKNFELLRFKNDPEVFETMLKHQRQVNTSAFAEDLQLGNAEAPVQILIACNPYCWPCANVHTDFHKLLDVKNFGLTVRFTIDSDKREDLKTRAVEYILKCISTPLNHTVSRKRQIIHDWFNVMDLDKFSRLYKASEELEVDSLLKQHDIWSRQAEIAFTPAIFINGLEMPKQFHVNDLMMIIGKWKNREEATMNY